MEWTKFEYWSTILFSEGGGGDVEQAAHPKECPQGKVSAQRPNGSDRGGHLLPKGVWSVHERLSLQILQGLAYWPSQKPPLILTAVFYVYTGLNSFRTGTELTNYKFLFYFMTRKESS
jgi:hypothetical protein